MSQPEAELWVKLDGADVRVGTIYAPRLGGTESSDAGSSPNHNLP